MKWVIVIESDASTFGELKAILSSYDEDIRAIQLNNIKEITEWFETTFIKGKGLQVDDDEDIADSIIKNEERIEKFPTEIPLIISDHRILGPKHMSLIKKMSDYFKSKKLLGARDRMGVVFVAREAEEVSVKPFLNGFIDNIIFKPFDRLVCKERFKWAIQGLEALQKEELYKEKPVTPVEMIEDHDLIQISELGFQIFVKAKVAVGSISKFYGEIFGTDIKNGIFARCIDCRAHPSDKSKFVASYTYFGINNNSIKAMRENIQKSEKKGVVDLTDHDLGATVGIVVVSENPETTKRLKETIAADYLNTAIATYENLVDFYLDLDPYSAADEIKRANYSGDKATDLVTLIYDSRGEMLLEIEPKISGRETLFGFNYDELQRFKTICMTAVDGSQRAKVQKYWSQHVESRYTISIRNTTQREIITLVESNMEVHEGKPRLCIKLRRAFHEEVVDYMKGKSTLPKVINAIFVSERIVMGRDQEYWVNLNERLKPFSRDPNAPVKIPYFVVGSSPVVMHEQVDELLFFSDYIMEPLDIRYFLRKLKLFLPSLFAKDSPVRVDFDAQAHPIQEGTPIHVEAVSEVSLSIKYTEAIREGEFRKFLLWSPKQNERPELLAKCAGNEKESPTSNKYLSHFTFFGMDDGINRFIRQWLLEQYQLTKEEEQKKN